MSMNAHDAITLGVQAGDREVDVQLEPYYMLLRKLLSTNCVGPYSDTIDEFAIVLRIDGNIWQWNFEGCRDVRLSKRKRLITIDVGVPRHVWEDVSSHQVKNYLIHSVSEALQRMVGRLQEEGIDVDEPRLSKDLQAVSREFLGDACSTR